MKDRTKKLLDAFLARAGRQSLVMGIVNVTPDSFSDGGLHFAPATAVAASRRMIDEGAAVLDFGGESTRPGFTPISAAEESARVLPVVAALADEASVPLSIDTTKAAVARAALAAGAAIVNDIWGFQGDPALAEVVAETGAAAVLMHNRREMDDAIDIVDDMRRFFEISLGRAERAGVSRDRLILDPGIGFGKTPRQQTAAIAGIARLRQFGLPILVGVSRKSFLGRITGAPVDRRGSETLGANLAAATAGASLFRVHDVADHVAALRVFDAIGQSSGAALPPTDHALPGVAGPPPAATGEGPHTVAIGLGSNIGDKAGTIRRALDVLQSAGILGDLRVSRLYGTAPWGPVPQDRFVNACAIGQTRLDPETLLARCKATEVALGRTDTIRWGPRVIDIDILLYDDIEWHTPKLNVPHIDLFNRAFVLVPLAELCPERRVGGIEIAAAAAAIDRTGVELLGP